MRNFRETFKKIYQEEKGLVLVMGLVFLLSLLLVIYGVFNINTSGSLNYVGYGDIGKFTGGEYLSLWNSGGYRSGGWIELMAFPALALIIGVLHNLLAVVIYKRRGAGVAKAFLLLSLVILLGAFITLMRLLGEG
ncbi:hypothetical protein IJG21_02535 [Candidatus Saccharibacteria bacterium]|nr:hypothetical protein [Candidatus Saccharibacteria bacterium]